MYSDMAYCLDPKHIDQLIQAVIVNMYIYISLPKLFCYYDKNGVVAMNSGNIFVLLQWNPLCLFKQQILQAQQA